MASRVHYQDRHSEEPGEIGRVIEHYRHLEHVSPDFIFVVDREFVIRYANRSAARLLRKNVHEMTGKYLELFFPPAAYREQYLRLRQVFESGADATSSGPVSLCGTELFLHTRWIPVRELSGDVSAVLCVARDVSDLRPAGARARKTDDSALLSDRERQVLNLIAEGMTNKEIGQTLFISPKTVDVHRTNIMKKLEAHNTAELILRSRKTGLLV